MTDLAEFTMSRHALRRALEMGVDPSEIRQCLIAPETMMRSKTHPGRNYRAGRIACGVVDNVVTTVVWSSSEGWRQDIETAGIYGGREYRG
ncbi:hypothetical protein [Mycobacterium phage WXIN]|nr:hypothetical protein [Mycobacterium phage WXIN]